MAANKTILTCLLWVACLLPVYTTPSDAGYLVRRKASSYVGIRERNGNNGGFTSPSFEKKMKSVGWTKGAPWCAFFVKLVLKECSVTNNITGWSPTSYNKADVIFTGGVFKTRNYDDGDVLVMSLSYSKFKNSGRYKGIGHTGIVEKIGKNSCTTIEGNTNDAGARDSRGGKDGVYRKVRPLSKSIHITRWSK